MVIILNVADDRMLLIRNTCSRGVKGLLVVVLWRNVGVIESVFWEVGLGVEV